MCSAIVYGVVRGFVTAFDCKMFNVQEKAHDKLNLSKVNFVIVITYFPTNYQSALVGMYLCAIKQQQNCNHS